MARSYLIFDIETIVDWDLLYQCEGQIGESSAACKERFIQESREKQGLSDFEEPWIFDRYHIPVSVAFIALDQLGRYKQHRVISGMNPGRVTAEFWDAVLNAPEGIGVETYVTFNGKRYDFPVMEANAYRHGVDMTGWVKMHTQYANQDPRASFNTDVHLDLFRILSPHGSPLYGSLDRWSALIGLPGKVCMDGSQVAETLKEDGGLAKVNDYCLADVLATAGVLLHVMRVTGELPAAMPISVYTQEMDTIVAGVKADAVPGGCVDTWTKAYEAGKKLAAQRAELQANGDDIPV